MVGGLRDVITCAEFQIEIFMGYDFTGGRIFDFSIDFSMGLTTVQRYCAACDYSSVKPLVLITGSAVALHCVKGTLRRRIAYIFFGPPGKYIL